jgi:hypothetical protein
MMKPTLVIGDVHGHLDRLEALLKQEGVIGECLSCAGSGDAIDPEGKVVDACAKCHGVGIDRINHDVEVVQLGDLGHYGIDTMSADRLTWEYAPRWLDVILWGNHDRATIDGRHFFMGYQQPLLQTMGAIDTARGRGQLQLAHEAHDFLLTHAGLHSAFKYNEIPSLIKDSPKLLVEWLNECDDWDHSDGNEPPPPTYEGAFRAIRDAIGKKRGGSAHAGGILWRDSRESLYKGFRQVFGHTKKDETREYANDMGKSYCIDVGDQHNGRLVGLWLPEERMVEVNTNRNETWEKP